MMLKRMRWESGWTLMRLVEVGRGGVGVRW
jgi:hypothetical protein